MTKLRFVAGVTLYNPSIEELKNLSDYSASFEKIFLFDNSEPSYLRPEYEFNDKFEIITEGNNMGLPYAFNCIIEKCDDYDYLCTLDQDSVFAAEDIEKIKAFISAQNQLEIGIVAPYIDYGFSNINFSETAEEKDWVITSGGFVNLSAIKKHSLRYDLNYFIDKFEIDLCQQMILKGYKILMYHGSVLHQSLGEINGHRHTNHSVLRHYYLFRNRLYFNNKWHHGVKKLFLNLLQTLRHFYLILMYEENKISKIKVFVVAVCDYKKGKLGKRILSI